MKIEIVPKMRSEFELKTAENILANRLVELFETVALAKAAHDEWVATSKPPLHRWVTYNSIALNEATRHWLPSERKKVSSVITFDVDKPELT